MQVIVHADKQSFYMLASSFLIKVVRYVQSIQKRKFTTFLQSIKKNCCNCFWVLWWCKTFRYFTGVLSCSLLPVIVLTLWLNPKSIVINDIWLGKFSRLTQRVAVCFCYSKMCMKQEYILDYLQIFVKLVFSLNLQKHNQSKIDTAKYSPHNSYSNDPIFQLHFEFLRVTAIFIARAINNTSNFYCKTHPTFCETTYVCTSYQVCIFGIILTSFSQGLI